MDEGKRRYRDFAVFMRINALSRSLEQAFVKHRVPFQIVKGLAFFERKENRDVLAYIRLLLNPRDDISFLRVVNEPARGIGKVSLDHLRSYAEPRELSLLSAAAEVQRIPAIKGKAGTGLRDFALLLAELIQLPRVGAVKSFARCSTGAVTGKCSKAVRSEEDADRLANIEEMITAAKTIRRRGASRTIGDFLENITLASDVDGWDENQDCVSIADAARFERTGIPGGLHDGRRTRPVASQQGACTRMPEVEEERLAFNRHDTGQRGASPDACPTA